MGAGSDLFSSVLPLMDIMPLALHNSSYVLQGWLNAPISGRRTKRLAGLLIGL
jgi:hypothetical protein